MLEDAAGGAVRTRRNGSTGGRVQSLTMSAIGRPSGSGVRTGGWAVARVMSVRCIQTSRVRRGPGVRKCMGRVRLVCLVGVSWRAQAERNERAR